MSTEITTIKDIAAALGVSLTTVHKAIYHKKGISEETRSRILCYIEENGFHLNRAASALKRRPIQLVYMGIEDKDVGRYFYRYINRGVADCAEELKAFNVQLSQYFTPELDWEKQQEQIEHILSERGDSIDGLLLVSVSEHHMTDVIGDITARGIKVATVNSDAYGSSRHAYIGSDATGAGLAAAEMMCGLGLPAGGQVLLLGGNRDMANHRANCSGFLTGIRQRAPQIDVLEIYEFFNLVRLKNSIDKYLHAFTDILGIYSNNARSTAVCCQAVKERGLSGRIKLIGADVFEELSPYFNDRTLTATVYQHPSEQGYRGLRNLYNLVTEEEKVPEITELNVGIALQSNYRGFL